MLEEKLERSVEQSAAALTAMADDFFDHPEVGLQEFHAFETLTGWLEKEGFTVERGIAGMVPRSEPSGSTARAARISACSASTMLWPVWATPVATICRDRPFWAQPRL